MTFPWHPAAPSSTFTGTASRASRWQRPSSHIGDPMANAEATLALMRAAAKRKAIVAVFPELGLSAYSCEDLFHQQALLKASEEALAWLLAQTGDLPLAAFVGLPVAVDGLLYNCAALICQGRLLGVVPKVTCRTIASSTKSGILRRRRTAGHAITSASTAPHSAPTCCLPPKNFRGLTIHIEICEDVWVPVPPSGLCRPRRRDGAGQPVGLETYLGKADQRRLLAQSQSARCLAAYVSPAPDTANRPPTSPGTARPGSSRTVHCLPRRRASGEAQHAVADIDLECCARNACAWAASTKPAAYADATAAFRRVTFRLDPPRTIWAFDAARALPVRSRRSEGARAGLLRGLPHPGHCPDPAPARHRDEKVVIGVSGGLD